MSDLRRVRNWLAALASTIGASISSLWLAWTAMSDYKLLTIICFWVALGWALGAGACVFRTVRALDTFRSGTATTSNSPCSTLKFALGGWAPIVASLALISVWGTLFTLSADNLLVALVFATTASALLTAASVWCTVLFWRYERAIGLLSSERTLAMR